MTAMEDQYSRIRMVSIGQMPVTGMKDQYCRIKMQNIAESRSILQNQVHGPTTIKVAQRFCLAVLLITFLLFQDFIKDLYQQIRIG